MGPGLLESTYEQCLAREFALQEVKFQLQVPVPIEYKGAHLDCGYRIDVLVERQLILELKAVDEISGIHKAQLLSYMKRARISIGLLLNFKVELLRNGITRFRI